MNHEVISFREMLLNPAGGLRYHWRALRYSQNLWSPFRQALKGWLISWEQTQKPTTSLLVFGPSAGYCLAPEFLERFERLICIEPEPLARALFLARLKGANRAIAHPSVEWVSENFLTPRQGAHYGLERFARCLASNVDAAVLFSNILGQLSCIAGERRHDEVIGVWRSGLQELLRGRSWASFHDRVSGLPQACVAQPFWSPQRLSDEDVLGTFYSVSSPGELFDHFTEGFFPANRPHTYFHWQLSPRWGHLIEATSSSVSM